MATYDRIQLEMEDTIENMNKVKDSVLNQLFKDKVITEEQRNEYSEKWQIII